MLFDNTQKLSEKGKNMFQKLLVIVVIATLLAGCATPSGVSNQPVPQPIEVPDSKVTATVVPAGATVQTSGGKMIQVPSPVAVPIPPTHCAETAATSWPV